MPVELKDHRPRHAGRGRFRYDTAAAYEGADDLEDGNVCRFWLNGTVYVVIEDPSDGYCSSMCAIKVVPSAAMMTVFPAIQALCRHKDRHEYHQSDLLELLDVVTAKPVLEVAPTIS